LLDLLRVSPANVLHGNEDDNESAAHDELPPMEVWRPLRPKQIVQLLLNGIVPEVCDCLSLDSLGRWDHILAVAKDVLHL